MEKDPLDSFRQALEAFHAEMDKLDARGPVYPAEVIGEARLLLQALDKKHPLYNELSTLVHKGNEAKINELAYQILTSEDQEAA